MIKENQNLRTENEVECLSLGVYLSCGKGLIVFPRKNPTRFKIISQSSSQRSSSSSRNRMMEVFNMRVAVYV